MANNENITIEELIKADEELEPETLSQLFPDLDSKDRQRIMALRILLHTRAAYEDFDVFENVCLAINDIEPSVGHTEGCKPRHIWYTINVVKKLFGDDIPEFSDDVLEYIKFMHLDEGLQFFPPALDIDNTKLDEVIEKAEKGPFPLGEEALDLQATYYLKIKEYLNSK